MLTTNFASITNRTIFEPFELFYFIERSKIAFYRHSFASPNGNKKDVRFIIEKNETKFTEFEPLKLLIHFL